MGSGALRDVAVSFDFVSCVRKVPNSKKDTHNPFRYESASLAESLAETPTVTQECCAISLTVVWRGNSV